MKTYKVLVTGIHGQIETILVRADSCGVRHSDGSLLLFHGEEIYAFFAADKWIGVYPADEGKNWRDDD